MMNEQVSLQKLLTQKKQCNDNGNMFIQLIKIFDKPGAPYNGKNTILLTTTRNNAFS